MSYFTLQVPVKYRKLCILSYPERNIKHNSILFFFFPYKISPACVFSFRLLIYFKEQKCLLTEAQDLLWAKITAIYLLLQLSGSY